MKSRIALLLAGIGLLVAAWSIDAEEARQLPAHSQTLTLQAVSTTEGSVVELRFGDIVLQTKEFSVIKANRPSGTFRAVGDKVEWRQGEFTSTGTTLQFAYPAGLLSK